LNIAGPYNTLHEEEIVLCCCFLFIPVCLLCRHRIVFILCVCIAGLKKQQKRSISDSSLLPKVHAYSLTGQDKRTYQKMDNSRSIILDSKTSAQVEPHDQLLKYPTDRITVVTEKCSYLTKSPDFNYRRKAVTCKDKILPVATGSYMSTASSHESIATGSTASVHLHSKSSVTSAHSVSNMANEPGFRNDSSMTTADHLAWELRRARDRLDTASSISGCSSRFELDSNYSERADTMSTVSDVSEYEEEMFRIKRLLLLDSAKLTPPSVKYETNKDQNLVPVKSRTNMLIAKENADMQIQRLNMQLQSALEEKEKYRIEALETETRINLEWQDKYQEVLRQKAHMEGRLETVQTEISTLVSGQNEVLDRAKTLEEELKLKTAAENKATLQEMEKLMLETHRLQQMVREADGRIQDLTVQLELRNSEVSQWKGEVQAAEDVNEKLRIELQELKIEAESKDGSIQGLKSKMLEQHVEIQSLLQAKLKAENNLTSLKNEIETARKSGCWYRDQLHVCQAAKVKVQQELITSQENIMSQSHQIERMKGEIVNLRQVVEKTQHKAVREKEALMRKLEVIQADMLEREATIYSQICNESSADTINTVTAKLKRLEEEKTKMLNLSDTAVQELKEEIASQKNELQTKETNLQASETENARLMTRVTALQKTLNERDLAVQLLESKCKNIEMSHSHLGESLKLKEQMLLELKNGKVAVEVALATAEREKTDVDVAIKKLRDDFAHISTSYQKMKSELREKEKHINNLKADINLLQREKQNQIEKINELRRTEEAFRELQSRISQTEAMEKQVKEVSKVNMELNKKINELSEAHSYVKQQMSKMEETIAAREEQLVNQTRDFEVHVEELKAKEQCLVELQNEKRVAEEHVRSLQARIQELEAMNEKLVDETASLRKQLSTAGDGIRQFNRQSRTNEEEKNQLQMQTKKVITGLEGTPVIAVNVVETVNTEFLSPEVLPTLKKSLSSHEYECIQTDLQHLYELIRNSESKLLLLLSGGHGTQEKVFQKEQVNTVLNNNLSEFDGLCSVLVNISDSIAKVLEWQNKLVTEIKTEKQSSEVLGNEVFDLKKGTRVNILSQDKQNDISYNKEIGKVNTEGTGSQTMNDDILNYKEQIDAFQKEMKKLKGSLKMSEIEHRERHRKYEANVRTLLRKVKEHMRGRKVAERALEELRGKTEESIELVTLRCENSKLQAELEASKQRCEEQKIIADRNQEALLVLEKERGKLAQSCNISKEKLPAVPQSSHTTVNSEFDQKARELQLLQTQDRITELEEQVRKLQIIIKELRREVS
jgi:chromosome segregation ATPase